MQVHLQSKRVGFSHALNIAVIDAVIWVWFYQMSHAAGAGLLTPGSSGLPHREIFGILATAIILFLKWDRFPRHFHIAAPLTTSVLCGLLMLLGLLGPDSGPVRSALLGALSIGSFSCQLLRFENLERSDNIHGLALALTASLVLFYGLNLVFTESSAALQGAFIVAAPCVLLVNLRNRVAPTANLRPLSLRSLAVIPNALVGVFGVAGGFVFVVGTLNTPTGLGDLLQNPIPTYPAMLLLYMALAIIAASGLRFPKAAYFSLVNLSWSLGTLLGTMALRVGLQVPETLSLVLAAASMMSFFLFQSAWIDRPENRPVTTAQRIEDVAAQHGLTKREVEVAALLLEGRSLRRIQTALFISEGTAKTHVKHIYAKLGVHTKQELIDRLGTLRP